MAKNSVTDYDTTAANNTDVGGIAIEGSDNVANFDNALRTIMSHAKTEQTSKQSALDGKLALAGGTMTGGLTATTLATTGQTSLGGRLVINDQDNADGSFPIQFQNDAQASWYLRALTTSNNFALHLSGVGDLMTLNSSGQLTATTLYPSGGVYLGGSTSSNLLDDYEEGSCTPAIAAGITSPVYSSQAGSYIKIGKRVFVDMQLTVSSGTLNSSALQISGLPFSVLGEKGGGIWRFAFNVVGASTDALPIIHPLNSSVLFYTTTGTQTVGTALSSATNLHIRISLSYETP